jgi:hypothetical protein
LKTIIGRGFLLFIIVLVVILGFNSCVNPQEKPNIVHRNPHHSICGWKESHPPPDLSVFIYGLAFILIIPEIYFGRRLCRSLRRKKKELFKYD